MTYIPRIITPPEGSYFLLGPRGTGKSTWLLHQYPNAVRIDLLLGEQERRFASYPKHIRDVVNAMKPGTTLILDEIQGVPRILPEIHALIEEKRNIQYIMTGSSTRKLRRAVSDLLGGRALSRQMGPFLAAEIGTQFSLEKALKFGLIPVIWESNSKRTENVSKSSIISKITSKVNLAFWTALGGWATYNLIDHGLSRFFALETLTHGTGPLGYYGINYNGADPNFGGSEIGSSFASGITRHIENSKKFFHVFKDTEFKTPFGDPSLLSFLVTTFGNGLLPKLHAILSGKANFGSKFSMSNWDYIGAAAGFLTPTLKFRFKPEEILNCKEECRFVDDPGYSGFAYRTKEPIEASRLGITGSLLQGIDSNMLDRMAANPIKVAMGVAFLGTAFFVARKTFNNLSSSQKTPSESNSTEKMTFFQSGKRIKWLAKGSFWATIAVAGIALNTL